MRHLPQPSQILTRVLRTAAALALVGISFDFCACLGSLASLTPEHACCPQQQSQPSLNAVCCTSDCAVGVASRGPADVTRSYVLSVAAAPLASPIADFVPPALALLASNASLGASSPPVGPSRPAVLRI